MSIRLKRKMRVLARISSCVIKWGPGNDVSFVEGPGMIIAHLVQFFTYKNDFLIFMIFPILSASTDFYPALLYLQLPGG